MEDFTRGSEIIVGLFCEKVRKRLMVILTLSCKMLKNGQRHFKNLAVFAPQDFWSIFSRKIMHERVNKKDVNDNKAFYKTIKRFPSDKTESKKYL